MVCGESDLGSLESAAAPQFSQLRRRCLGPKRGRRTVGARWPPLEEFREMILAGDIGGTHARLGYFQAQNGHLKLLSESVFPSREYRGLDEIVVKFVEREAIQPETACFGIPGPVLQGRGERSNLPSTVEASLIAAELHLPCALLINDLEANAWGIQDLAEKDFVSLNQV